MLSRIMLGLVMVVSASAVQAQEFGEKISVEESTSIGEILENFKNLEGKRVRIEGRIVDVCTMAGCWIEIQGASGDRIRFKVDDGVIVFPESAKGKEVTAEGRVEVLPMEREQYIQWLQHLAEETGKQFDPDSVGDPPYRIVRLRGLGAVVGPAS